MKQTITILLLAILLHSCSTATIITQSQKAIITSIDTVGKKQVYIRIVPVSTPSSCMGNGLRIGDTVRTLIYTKTKY